MSAEIERRERVNPELLPDLRQDSELVLASDYAGEHQDSEFQVLAYLLTDRTAILTRWDAERLALRQRFLPNGRRIAFKKLNDDQCQQKAVVPFLDLARSLNGILFFVAVEKSVELAKSWRTSTGEKIANWSPHAWKPKVIEKLVRVAFFGGFLVGGLCRSGQNLHWITDDDEIVPNETWQDDAGQIIGGTMHQCCPENMGEHVLGIAGKFDDNRRAEDLVSIVDLAGGAVAESLTLLGKENIPRSANIYTPVFKPMSVKSQIIYATLFGQPCPLKRLMCVVRTAGPGEVLVSFTEPTARFSTYEGEPTIWAPPGKGWIKAARSWR